jgi:hypothetical protein
MIIRTQDAGECRMFFCKGAIIRMKSGQLPCMYAKLHLGNWVKQLEEFSAAAFPPDMLV